MNKSLHLSYGSNTDNGLVKEFNTDSVLEFKILDGHAFVICDGHNGNDGHGALASKLTSESIKKYFYNRSYKDILKALTNAITFANHTLFDLVNKDSKYEGIGSTLATMIYRDGMLYYAYAGDSRIYVFKNNQLQPLTRDHVDNPTEAAGAEVKLLIGKNKDIKFGVCKKPLEASADDIYLLCTDGLTDQLTEDEISEIICDRDKAPEHKCQNLLDIAREKGGKDCTSVQILEFSSITEQTKKRTNINLKPILIGLLGIIGIAAISFAGYQGYEYLKKRQVNKPLVEQPKIINKEKTKDAKTSTKKQKNDLASKNTTNSAPKEDKIETKTNNTNKSAKTKVVVNKPKQNKNTTVSEQIYFKHKIKYGDNLYRIAIRYNTTQKKLININGKKATNLIAGSSIKIPVTAIHKVKPGESFSFVSDKYNTKIDKICAASKIDKNTQLKEGQILIIPLSK